MQGLLFFNLTTLYLKSPAFQAPKVLRKLNPELWIPQIRGSLFSSSKSFDSLVTHKLGYYKIHTVY